MEGEMYNESWNVFSDDGKFSITAWETRGVMSDLTQDHQDDCEPEGSYQESMVPVIKKEHGRQPFKGSGSLAQAAYDAMSLRNRTTDTSYADQHCAEALRRFRSSPNTTAITSEIMRRLAGTRLVDVYGVAHEVSRDAVSSCVEDIAMVMCDRGEAREIVMNARLRDNLAPTLRRLNGALITRVLSTVEGSLELFCKKKSGVVVTAEKYFDPTDMTSQFWKQDEPLKRPRATARTIEDRAAEHIQSKQYRHHRSTHAYSKTAHTSEHAAVTPREIPSSHLEPRAKGGSGRGAAYDPVHYRF